MWYKNGVDMRMATTRPVPRPAAVLPPGGAGPRLGTSGQGQEARSLPRPVVAAHVGTLVAGLLVWSYLDRHLWFYGDEWDFIVLRGLAHAQVSLWAPHNEHWSTLPILVWRAIFALVHLSRYWPYVLALLLTHLAVVHLFWRRCLREGTDPWVATALALLVVLLGTAAEDLAWAFQVGFLGSLAFGLVALELVERQGPRSWALAAVAAVGSLMCSDIGVALLVSLAVVAVARRGWRRGVVMAGPGALAFGAWYLAAGYRGIQGDHITMATLRRVPGFMWDDTTRDVARAFSLDLAGLSWLATVLVACLLAWALLGSRRLLRQHPAVVALLAGDLAFHAMAAVARDRFGETFSPSRYVYIDAVLLLPGLAVMLRDLIPRACDLLPWARSLLPWAGRVLPSAPGGPQAQLPGVAGRARRLPGPALRWLAVGVLAACTVGNVVQGDRFVRSRTGFVLLERQQILTGAQLLAEGQRAISATPIRYSGWLSTRGMLALERRHLLPEVPMTASARATGLTVLDVAIAARPLVPGRFRLLDLSGGAAGKVTGVGCLTVWAAPHARVPQLALQLARGDRSAAVHLASLAGTLRSFLTPGRHPLPGQAYVGLAVRDGGGWVSDAVASYHLVFDVPPGRSTLCGLAGPLGTPQGGLAR